MRITEKFTSVNAKPAKEIEADYNKSELVVIIETMRGKEKQLSLRFNQQELDRFISELQKYQKYLEL